MSWISRYCPGTSRMEPKVWNSPYVGLKNINSTCYLNAVIQTLFFTNKLRTAVFALPWRTRQFQSCTHAIQETFVALQFGRNWVDATQVLRSLGYDQNQSEQRDVQEFLRLLLNELETGMLGTELEGTVPQLFQGKISSFIRCTDIDYTSKKIETFYDIQLNVKDNKDIYESFDNYVSIEVLDGNNKYQAGPLGKQKAEKGVIFVELPPVLHLHLMRVGYDPITGNAVKYDGHYEFYEQINLSKYLKDADENSKDAEYELHTVIAHRGNAYSGHYVAYIKPDHDDTWFEFNDCAVTACSVKQAVVDNFFGNAYMLVYVKKTELSDVLADIDEEAIPSILIARFKVR